MAVDLMSRGDFCEALALFRGVIDRLLAHRKEDGDGDDHEDQDMQDSDADVLVQSLSIREFPSPLSKESEVQWNEQHAFSVFDRAFIVGSHREEEEDALSSALNRDRTSAVVIFNMALAYQLMGMKDANKQGKNFERALSFYQLAVKVLGKSVDIDESKLMFLAAANNMGCIYSHSFDAANMQCCLNWMATVLEAQNESMEDEEDDLFSFFHLTVMILLGNETPAAPAA